MRALSRRTRESGSRRVGGRLSGRADRAGAGHDLQRRRDPVRDRRERARSRLFRRAVHQQPGQSPPDGTADHGGRAAALVGAAHHGGDSLLRLRAPGSQGRPARADHGQARRRPDLDGRHRSRALHRPARRPDPGLLQHPRRQPLRDAACCSPRSRASARTSASSRPTRAAWSARAPTRSASTPGSRSSTSGARRPTSRRSCTSSATSRASSA